MKKMLIIPQISCKSSKGEILLENDSGMNLILNMLDELTKEMNVTIAFPFNIEKMHNKVCDMFQCYNNLSFISDCSHEYTDAKTERMNFHVSWYKYLKNVLGKIDYVFVAEPTQVVNIKAIFSDAYIITYNSWLAFKNMKEIHLRQFEGMCAADLTLVNSNYAKYEILKKYKDFDDITSLNIKKLPPAYNQKIAFREQLKNKVDKLGIVYNHRLSSDEYYKNAYETFIEIVRQLELKFGEDKMPDIYFTNPSGKEVELPNKKYIHIVDLKTQEEYINFLQSEKVQIHVNTFFKSEGMWAMSTVEAAITGNICLLPKKYGYAEIFSDDYYGYCNCSKDLLVKLWEIIDQYSLFKAYNDRKLLNYHGNEIGRNFINMLNGFDCIRPWGNYQVLYYDKNKWVKVLKIKAGKSLSLQKHKYRSESWDIRNGRCKIMINNIESNKSFGDTVRIPQGIWHNITAITDCLIIETAEGELVHEDDIIRKSDKYGRE